MSFTRVEKDVARSLPHGAFVYSGFANENIELIQSWQLKDAELEIYMSAVGKVKFEFTGSTDVKEICKIISTYALA